MTSKQNEKQILTLKQSLKDLEEKATKHKQAALDGDESLSSDGISHGELAIIYTAQAREFARKIEALEQQPPQAKGRK